MTDTACFAKDRGFDRLYGDDGDDTLNGGGEENLPLPGDIGNGGAGQDTCFTDGFDATCERGKQLTPTATTVNEEVTVDPAGETASVSGEALCVGRGTVRITLMLFGSARGVGVSDPIEFDDSVLGPHRPHKWSVTVSSRQGKREAPGSGTVRAMAFTSDGEKSGPETRRFVTFVEQQH
ncbi:hypothetical protein ACQUSR_27970 [Streptomyces sp. P1-3]|uniref:hypothetical protein n=1 Tax=Streptomyces sp. P1-3 TaxID=3421658 RepID=UPI003D35D5E5